MKIKNLKNLVQNLLLVVITGIKIIERESTTIFCDRLKFKSWPNRIFMIMS